MTSNIRSAEDMAEPFRPEFLSRIDEIVEIHARLNERPAERAASLGPRGRQAPA